MAKQVWKFEPAQRWIRGTLNGETIVDSKRARLMIESPGEVDYYFPLAEVRMDLLEEEGILSSEDLQILEEIHREKEGQTNEPD